MTSIQLFHSLTGLITTTILCLAAVQAMLFAIQNNHLRYRISTKIINRLPPLESMETILFQLVRFGFILLSLVLFTSLYLFSNSFSYEIIEHSAFAILSWLIFLILILGRRLFGWRGKKAVYGTLAGAILSCLPLLFGYF